ncbi:hypothetical protein sos41_17740 [Alphaproteobacteria bacterium SO-S41]|nr:hypothetical protein sos41_17740 [Alphaproteobacteria bacterium SO-S41]
MALEKAPKAALKDSDRVKSYLPPADQTAARYTIRDGKKEGWTSVAERHNVPVEALIEFNFPGSIVKGKLVPEIVNWYLGNHHAFRCPETADRKNRRFRGGENIAIPIVGRMERGEKVFNRPEPVISLDDDPGPGYVYDLLPGQKFGFEVKLPPDPKKFFEYKYFIAVLKINFEGEIVTESAVKFQYKKDKMKAAAEAKLTEDWKVGFGAALDKLGPQYLEKIAKAVATSEKQKVVAAIAEPFELAFKNTAWTSDDGSYSIGHEFTIEGSPAFAGFKGSYTGKNTLKLAAGPVPLKFTIKFSINIGLSADGWKAVFKYVGEKALKQFFQRAGAQLAATWQYLLAEGIVAGAAIAFASILGGISCTALIAWTIDNVNERGDRRGYATWYSAGYVARLFNHPLPAKPPVGDMAKIDEMIALGSADSVTDARRILRDNGRDASGNDNDVLRAYRDAVVESQGGDENAAKVKLRDSLTRKSKQAAGL